jgi:diaminopimelate epimerase
MRGYVQASGDQNVNFVKMHGLGNDYVYINAFEQQVADPVALARRVSDRHRGIGSDGLILVAPSKVADVRMEMYNADGSRGKMCGNGIRCVAKFAVERGLVRSGSPGLAEKLRHRNVIAQFLRSSTVYLTVETDAGIRELAAVRDDQGKVQQVCVDMGSPILQAAQVPVDVTNLPGSVVAAEQPVIRQPLALSGGTFPMTCVSMGNPHAVFFLDDLAKIDLYRDGPLVETHAAFPDRINAHFVQVVSAGEVKMLTWERGSGATQACGTGACAVCVAGVLEQRTGRSITAHLPGGDLMLEWSEDDKVYMTGPAEEAFSGTWPET